MDFIIKTIANKNYNSLAFQKSELAGETITGVSQSLYSGRHFWDAQTLVVWLALCHKNCVLSCELFVL